MRQMAKETFGVPADIEQHYFETQSSPVQGSSTKSPAPVYPTSLVRTVNSQPDATWRISCLQNLRYPNAGLPKLDSWRIFRPRASRMRNSHVSTSQSLASTSIFLHLRYCVGAFDNRTYKIRYSSSDGEPCVSRWIFSGSVRGRTWNDMIDQDLDPKVSRTLLRPMARRAISNSSALIFVVVQIMIRLALVLASLPRPCFFYSIPSILLTGLYSYAKRFTHYP